MAKKEFKGWRWECIDVQVEYNLPHRIVLYFAWPIPAKKNNRQNFGRVSLPSQNYIEWHKRVVNKLKNIEWRREWWPCRIDICSIVWDRVRSDCDNQVSSVLDTLIDLGIIEDDNRFIVKEINVRNVGYAKNCWLHRVEITPRTFNEDIGEDHKGEDLFKYREYLDKYNRYNI